MFYGHGIHNNKIFTNHLLDNKSSPLKLRKNKAMGSALAGSNEQIAAKPYEIERRNASHRKINGSLITLCSSEC